MNNIIFPLLNIKIKVSQIAFTLFGIDIYWYAILIVSAMIIALIIYKKRDGLYNIKFDDILALVLILIPVALLSARIYFVLFTLDYYIKNPLSILNFRTGGLAIYGGIIGGMITCYIFCKKRKIKLINLFDYMAPGIALRTSNREMGKFYKHRSLWFRNYTTLENGNIRTRNLYRGTPNISV